jgi:hypothetical protein
MPKPFTTHHISISMYLTTYAKFDLHTMATLKKLLGVGYFGITVGHLVHRQVIFFLPIVGLGFLQWFNLLPPPS